ncbi:uncharacterized protein LOC143430358 [Xylocopa sonorina]|uniref:uncharacterized protein LOC143430358 n=1 Tax=Xylocopa sonorina TaxID=1818115 RepID=UPI00403A9D41
MNADAQEDQTDLQDEEKFLISVEDTLNIVEKSIHNFIKDVPEALVNSGLTLDLEKLNIQDGKKIQDLICSYRNSNTDRKHEEENERISTLESECAQLRSQLHQQMDVNKKAQEEIEYLREQVILR